MLSLLSPLLIWGTLLGAIPLIIHLLNRRRFRRVEWAPMRYLKLTIRRNRRRIQVEQLLLLLLRIALPVVLFLLLARPILNPTGLEGWLGGRGRSSQVVLVDDSLSMGYEAGGPPAFRRAVEVASALLAAASPRDRCTLVTTSEPSTPVLLEVEGSRRDELTGAALGLSPSETHAAWPAVLTAVDGVIEACTYPTRQLTIVTDLRQSGWDPGVGPTARRWREKGVRVRVVDVGGDERANVAITALSPVDRTVLAGAESRWEAVVRNDSPRSLAGVKATLRVDDRPTEVALPEVASGQSLRVPLAVRFPDPGPHELSLELPEDALAGDNRRWVALDVRDSLLIRLVDGEPSAEPFGGEVDYLAAPLSVGVGDAEAWRVEVVEEEDFLSPRLEPADVLVLANVAGPTPEQAAGLASRVEEGMGLMIFAGSRIDISTYNELLDREGERILPMPLKGMVDEEVRGLVLEPVRPSPIEQLLELKASVLERVPVRQFMGVEEKGDDGGRVRVLARWNDPGRSPALVERVAGLGEVLLWTTTADRAGNDWPVEPSFVLAVREAVRGVARPTSLAHNVTAGERLRRVVESDQEVSGVRLTPPGGEPRPTAAVPFETGSGGVPAVAIDVLDTRRAGVYRIGWDEGPLGAQQDLYAANPDPRESDLERIGAEDLRTLLRPLDVEVASARGDGSDLFAPTGRELWREMAWVLLGMMVVESIFATWVGRSR